MLQFYTLSAFQSAGPTLPRPAHERLRWFAKMRQRKPPYTTLCLWCKALCWLRRV